MEHRKPAAFLSYARADDRHAKGRIVKICELLSNELQAQTGEPFPIFIDRNHIDWGETWESRINESLEAATLLIPVITPNYFRSNMCRQEFRNFLEKERRIGRSDLILPIYYIEAPEMKDPTLHQEDDLAQELARRQYADWRKLRWASLESKRVLETIEGLAQRMRKAVQRGLGTTSTKAPTAGVDPAPGVFEASSKVDQDMRRLSHLYHLDRLGGPIVKPYEHLYDDWQQFKLKHWHAVNNPSLDARLTSGRIIRIDRNEQMWKPEQQHVEELRRLLSLRLDSDEYKIRLSSDLLPSTDIVRVQRTAYSAFLVTNRLGSYEIRERGNSREPIDADEIILRAGRLPTLARSKCSNHLGVDVLAFTIDGRIIITVQSNKNQLSPDLLAPSGSGSVDWDDLRDYDDLITVLSGAMRREMSEELGLPPSELPELGAIRVLGYARMSHLGGKPQFFGVVRLNLVHEQIQGIEEQYIQDYREICFDPERGIDDVVKAIRSFDRRYRTQMSFPLYINLQIVLRWLTENPEAAGWLGISPPDATLRHSHR